MKSKQTYVSLKSTPVSSHRLQNYLRTFRKRAGLSQDEVAFLLGCRSGTKVSRYEHFRRLPTLQTAFAYEIIFRTSARELFAGVFEGARRTTIRRVQALHEKLDTNPPERMTAQKLAALDAALEPAHQELA